MAEEFAGERTEQPTPRKRTEAREKGQVARSQDLNTAVLLMSATLLLYFVSGMLLGGLADVGRESYGALAHARVTYENVIYHGRHGLFMLIQLMLPFVLTMLLVGVLINFVQVGFQVTTDALTPNASRLNPLKGIKRILSLRGLMRLVFGLFKLLVIGGILIHGFTSLLAEKGGDGLLSLLHASPASAFDYSSGILFALGAKAAGAMLVLAILDFVYQRWQHDKDLMMTKEEVREELKRMEGDPKLKERRKRLGQQLALQRMMHDVPKADVVITNPSHVACAVQYHESKMRAPKLLAKGKGYIAHRIRERALELDIPVVEEPPLARMIYDTTEVGAEIPPDLYKPVAEVLAYVYRLGNRKATAAAAG